MRRISSQLTFWYKRGFPLFWFGFLAVWTVLAWYSMARKSDFQIMFVIIPLFMAVFGYFLMRSLIFDLVDSVWDHGDEIIIHNRGKEERVALTNILNISHSSFSNPPRITLTLREKCLFGDEIVFIPPLVWKFGGMHPLAKELIRRVDEERNR